MAARIVRRQKTSQHISVNFFFKLRNWQKKEPRDLSRNLLQKVGIE
jgi:SRSO17 transposase